MPGSVAFLNSGTTLHPILAKSQCWCVDGETIFVLRIRLGSYYRIELPNKSEEDSKVAEELKGVLARVLQFETTPCPFNRNFTVELPESPKTPIRKRPWRPFEQPKIERVWNAEDNDDTDEYLTAVSDNDSHSDTEDERGNNIMEETVTPRVVMPRDPDVFSTPTRPKGLPSMTRSITAPVQTSARKPRNSGLSSPLERISSNGNEVSSLSSSVDSFQSFYSTRSPLPPSPPYSNPPSPDPDHEMSLPRRRRHRRDVSEITITPGPPGFLETTKSLEDSPISLPPTTPTSTSHTEHKANVEEWSLVKTPPQSSELRQRRSKTSRQRALSPLPSPANIYSPSPCHSGHRLATAVLQRTCSLIAGPLISLMLRIASRIANGAVRGVAFGYGDKGEKIPCQWDYSEGEDGEANLDDYGVPLRAISTSSVKIAEVGGSWEVD